MYIPGPNIGNDVWIRRAHSNRAYSICGVTHTTATETIMDAFGALLTDPVQNWDAVVCTSSVVKKTLERVVNSYADYLQDRLGIRPTIPVQTPIIPLGVDCSQFDSLEKESVRAAWRVRLGISESDIAVLFVGRLSFTAKAHPITMFLALEEAARRTKSKVYLLLAGWFDPSATETLWRQDAKKYCPSLEVVFLDGRQDDVRQGVWHAADIFTSLSDNIQETFGLTPIEAMAAGLPVVVTDWDGYRDTVRHGIDGLRVPTLMPEPGTGEELAVRFANKVDNYGKYCGTVSQMTSVDIASCVAAYSRLIQDKELRLKMGDAGRQRAQMEYDWSVIVRKYQELWQELAVIRGKDKEIAPVKEGQPPMPLRMDPFTLFREYPSGYIVDDSQIALQAGRIQGWLAHISSSVMNSFVGFNGNMLLTTDEQATIVEYLRSRQWVAVSEIMKLFPTHKAGSIKRTLGWMGKNAIIAIRRAQKA